MTYVGIKDARYSCYVLENAGLARLAIESAGLTRADRRHAIRSMLVIYSAGKIGFDGPFCIVAHEQIFFINDRLKTIKDHTIFAVMIYCLLLSIFELSLQHFKLAAGLGLDPICQQRIAIWNRILKTTLPSWPGTTIRIAEFKGRSNCCSRLVSPLAKGLIRSYDFYFQISVVLANPVDNVIVSRLLPFGVDDFQSLLYVTSRLMGFPLVSVKNDNRS